MYKFVDFTLKVFSLNITSRISRFPQIDAGKNRNITMKCISATGAKVLVISSCDSLKREVKFKFTKISISRLSILQLGDSTWRLQQFESTEKSWFSTNNNTNESSKPNYILVLVKFVSSYDWTIIYYPNKLLKMSFNVRSSFNHRATSHQLLKFIIIRSESHRQFKLIIQFQNDVVQLLITSSRWLHDWQFHSLA